MLAKGDVTVDERSLDRRKLGGSHILFAQTSNSIADLSRLRLHNLDQV
jgi:hypothetical protein